jgi:uncharacterized protein
MILFAVVMVVLGSSAQARDWCRSSRLNPTERTICSYSELKQLDRQMVRLYGSARAKAQDYGQLSWLKYRRDACGTHVECIRREYYNRIGTLKERIEHNDITSARPWCVASRLNRTELTICNSSRLRNLDARMQLVYGQAKARHNDDGQMEWLQRRNACGGNELCIEDRYLSRINQLKARLKPYRMVSSNTKTCSQEKLNHLKTVCVIAAVGEEACEQAVYAKMSHGAISGAQASALCSAAASKVKDGSIDLEDLGLSIVSGFLSGVGDSMIDEGDDFLGSLFKGFSGVMTLGTVNSCMSRAERLCGYQ